MSEGHARSILRVAAGVATLQAAAHLTLFLRSQPTPGSPVWPLVQMMKAQAAPGHTNYWAIYFGYGLLSAVTAFFVACLIWLASTFDSATLKMARRLVGIVLVATAAHAIVIARYFFPVPLYFDILVAALLAAGWFAMGDRGSAVTR